MIIFCIAPNISVLLSQILLYFSAERLRYIKSVKALYWEWLIIVSGFQVYFIKKVREPIPREVPMKNYIMYGDVSTSPIDQLSAFVDEVCLTLLKYS